MNPNPALAPKTYPRFILLADMIDPDYEGELLVRRMLPNETNKGWGDVAFAESAQTVYCITDRGISYRSNPEQQILPEDKSRIYTLPLIGVSSDIDAVIKLISLATIRGQDRALIRFPGKNKTPFLYHVASTHPQKINSPTYLHSNLNELRNHLATEAQSEDILNLLAKYRKTI